MPTLIATCAFGLEALVADELRKLGYEDITVDRGKVSFEAGLEGICRANIWLRCADRVQVCMGQFSATTFDELFDQTAALPWADWLPEDAEFPVDGKSIKSQLSSVPACQAVTKKAVVTAMTRRYGREQFPETGPRFRIQVALLKDTVTLTLDTTGEGLHKRGYRDLTAQAPLRETLAAAMIYLSHWEPEYILADPCCGSGTIPIEAAMIGRNIAPGTQRSFDAFRWACIPRQLWSEAIEEADDLAEPDKPLRVWGSDISADVLSLAHRHAERAGVADTVEFTQRPLQEFKTHHKYGYLLANPPYGERLGDVQQAEALYRDLGQVYSRLKLWSCLTLTPHERFEKLFGARATYRRKLYNGRIQCWLYQFFGPKPPGLTAGERRGSDGGAAEERRGRQNG